MKCDSRAKVIMDLRKFIMDERVRRTKVAEERIQKSKNEFDRVCKRRRREEKDESTRKPFFCGFYFPHSFSRYPTSCNVRLS